MTTPLSPMSKALVLLAIIPFLGGCLGNAMIRGFDDASYSIDDIAVVMGDDPRFFGVMLDGVEGKQVMVTRRPLGQHPSHGVVLQPGEYVLLVQYWAQELYAKDVTRFPAKLEAGYAYKVRGTVAPDRKSWTPVLATARIRDLPADVIERIQKAIPQPEN